MNKFFCFFAGNCAYSFELTPRTLSSSFQLIPHGLVRMEIKFKKAVTQPLSVVLYAQHDVILVFNKDREYEFQ